jgi:TetR/AcrR family transcriptional repressor of nem operon
MFRYMKETTGKTSAKEKILFAALKVIRQQGYSATTVDDLCLEAGVTKGAFFHHFKSKEDLAISATQFWSQKTDEVFSNSPYQKIADPLERLLSYIDARRDLIKGDIPEFTCLLGTMVQETYNSSPALQKACGEGILHHAEQIAEIVSAAKKKYAPKAKWGPMEISLHIQAVIQGAFIVAKATDNPKMATTSIAHLKKYIELLFQNDNH